MKFTGFASSTKKPSPVYVKCICQKTVGRYSPDECSTGKSQHRGVLLCRVILTTDDVENVRTALGLLTTDFADGSRNRDGVLEEHLLTSFESIVMLSIVKKKRTKRKSFSWLFQAIVAVFKLPLGRE